METAILLFKQYGGSGMIVGWFLIAVVYLWFTEKEYAKRKILVWLPIGLVLLFFCPFVVIFMETMAEEDVYWRLLWSIPMLVVIAYAGVVVIRMQEGIKRYFSIAALVVLICVSGNYLYDNSGFQKTENLQHIPEEVIEICDAITVEGREVMAAFPVEMLMYVPQYTPFVHMPYGREVVLQSEGIINYDDLYLLIETDVVDCSGLVKELRAQGCHYVVLNKDILLTKKNKEWDEWILFFETEKYAVFMDSKNSPQIY